MQIKFSPHYAITPKIASNLMRIEAVKEKIIHLPLTPLVLSTLRETARLYTTHYSTMIEGNRLKPDQIETVLKHEGHFPGRKRDENEVKGYYAALQKVEQSAAAGHPLTEKMIQMLHELVMADGRIKVKPTPYRDGQNVIRDGRTQAIIYMPPEAKDVPGLMKGMVDWIQKSHNIPCPLLAAISHYQFATIHPYYDGNGRTARLLTTLILHQGGYELKGIYSLEEYYVRHLDAYYEAINIGNSHNYYSGRAEADLEGLPDLSSLMRKLDPKQRKVLELFQEFEIVTSQQIGTLFGFQPRTSAQICKTWVTSGFLEIVDPSNRGRTYRLSKHYKKLINSNF